MVDTQAVEFFLSIQAKTEAGKVQWQPTAEEDQYVATVAGEFTLVMRRMRMVLSLSPDRFSLILKDKEGRTLLTADDSVDGINIDGLRKLFQASERSALHVDEKLGRLMDELERL